MKMYAIAFGIFVLFAASLSGAYVIVEKQFEAKLTEDAKAALENGDYLASLNFYNKLGETNPDEVVTEEKIQESKDLLVAEEIFQEAELAAANGDWFKVKALLQRGDAATNPSFKFYEQAVDLYIEAANKVKDLEIKIESELTALRQEAQVEKTKREDVEEEISEVKEELLTTIQEKEAEETILKQQVSQAEAQKQIAEAQAEKERLLKFLSELELYLDMLLKGNGNLDDAIAELEQENDTTALFLISEGKTLFNEVRERSENFLNLRTENEHKDEVRTLIQITDTFINAAKQLGIATIYTDDQESEEFQTAITNAKNDKASALRVIGDLKTFIANERS